MVTNSFLPLCLKNITHNITRITHYTFFCLTPSCLPPELSLYLQYFLCKYTCILVSEKITCISAYISRGCSRPLFGSYTGSESSFTYLSIRKSLSLVKDKTRFSGSTCRFSVALVTRKHKNFPGICDTAGGKAATPHIPGLFFQRNSIFLYSLLKSAANAHVCCDCYRTCYFCEHEMLLEYSFGKLKYDSTTLSMSGFLGSSPVSASKSPVSLLIFLIFY